MSVLFVLLLSQNQHILFRSDKVWTLLAVMLVIWVSVLVLLVRLDRRLTRVEKQLNNHA